MLSKVYQAAEKGAVKAVGLLIFRFLTLFKADCKFRCGGVCAQSLILGTPDTLLPRLIRIELSATADSPCAQGCKRRPQR